MNVLNQLQAAAHKMEITIDRANHQAAADYLETLRSLLVQDKLRRHQLRIMAPGLYVVDNTSGEGRCWFEVRDSERDDVTATIRALGAELDHVSENHPAIFRLLEGITL